MNAPTRVLAVDDDPGILNVISMALDEHNIEVATARNGEDAVRMAQEEKPDILLLDVMMPGMDGLQTLKLIRETSDVPVVLVTAKDAQADKITGLELGADDYMTKPFSVEELRARVAAVLRRTRRSEDRPRVVRAGEVEIDLNRRIVTRSGQRLTLTRTEWLVLQEMALHPGRTILNSQLLTRVWGPEYADDVAYLRVWISRLRQKLEADSSNPTVIRTVGRAGYVLEAEDPNATGAQGASETE